MPARRRRLPGLDDFELRQYNCCKWIGRLFQGPVIPTEIDQFDDRKPNPDLRTPIIVPEVVRPPGRMLVAQHSQARDLVAVAVVNPVTVHVHSLREGLLPLSLNFDVNQQPGLPAAVAPDLEKLVSEPLPHTRVADDLLELLVEALVPAGPVNAGVNFRKTKREERFEKVLERFLPRTIEIVRLFAL